MCNAQLTPHGVWGLVLKAQEAPGYERLGPTRHAWDISGSCSEPRGLTIVGKPWRSFQHTQSVPGWGRDTFGAVFSDVWSSSVQLEMSVPCRRCEHCRRFRQWLWAQRAMQEARASMRIWGGTLTFNPHEVFLIRARAEARLAKRAVKWVDLDEGSKFQCLQAEAGRYVTLWLKRLRKAGHRFRYVITCEAHVSGVPHFHLVLHELLTPITKRALSSSWTAGFSKFKLVPSGDENRAIRYVTKYIAKNGASRIRASIRYGVATERGSADAWEAVSGLEVKRGAFSCLDKTATYLKSGKMLDQVQDRGAEAAAFLAHLDAVWPVFQTRPEELADPPTRRERKREWRRE